MYKVQAIGMVKSKFKKHVDPLIMRKYEHKSEIIIYDEFLEGLSRLEESEFIQVIFYFHLQDGYSNKCTTRSGEIKGVFASRSPKRPSAIGLSTVRLKEIKNNILCVQGLDALDETPVLDIKPYAPIMDSFKLKQYLPDKQIKINPRAELVSHIRDKDLKICLIKSGMLHGHFCPGLALGVIAGVDSLNQFDQSLSDGMENLIAIVETNNCFADGVQFITGCTFGNNGLVYRDLGKTAFTLCMRGVKGLRYSLKPDCLDQIFTDFPEYSALFEKVIKRRSQDENDIQDFKRKASSVSFSMLNKKPEELFEIKELSSGALKIPEYAPVYDSLVCRACGEGVIKSRISKTKEDVFCLSCAGKSYYQLQGDGIICADSNVPA